MVKMVAHGYYKGWKVYYDNGWRYTDNGMKVTERPCKKCGKYATEEGHDSCLGKLPNVLSACCGHGVKNPYIYYENGIVVGRIV